MSHSNRFHFAVALVAVFLAAPACSTVLPYESSFQCKNNDYGKCIHPQDAYAEAVGGDAGATEKSAVESNRNRRRSNLAPAGGYAGYQNAVYDQLAGLIEEPVTPMIAPATTVRTLILPYADNARETRLYMPRFVYSVLAPPKFVLGDYLQAGPHDFAGAIAEGLLIAPDEREKKAPQAATRMPAAGGTQ